MASTSYSSTPSCIFTGGNGWSYRPYLSGMYGLKRLQRNASCILLAFIGSDSSSRNDTLLIFSIILNGP